MKKILLVEDDAVIVEIYRKKFQREGYTVLVAGDGLTAMKELPAAKPDLVVLDLMLPQFNGADVLKFIRANPALKHTKVVIFSNAYMTEIALTAARAGADAALLKTSSTPAQLIHIVKTLLEGGGIKDNQTIPEPQPPSAPTPTQPTTATAPLAVAAPDLARPFELPKPAAPPVTASQSRIREEFLTSGPAALRRIRDLSALVSQPQETQHQMLRLKDLHRQMHFFTDHATTAGCNRLAHLAAALEALLFEMQERPAHINPSTLQTIATAVQLLDTLLRLANRTPEESFTPLNLLAVLVVDDEPLSNRALVHALSRANVKPTSVASSATALELFQKNHYDLLLLDYLMPGMNGLELYDKLRALPQYRETPVIFVTAAADFKATHQEILARGDDVIAKPIFPIELAIKALSLVLKRQLPPAH